MEDSKKYENIKTSHEKMMKFLNTPTISAFQIDDDGLYRYMNLIVNYVKHHHMRGQQVQPLNPPQRVTNIEANTVRINQNHSSRRPQAQETKKPSTNQNPENPIGSLRAQQPTVVTTKQQISSGPQASSVIGSGSPVSLSQNTNATNLPVVNQRFSSKKMKQRMHNMRGRSPLCSSLVNPITQQTSASSNVNKVLHADSIAKSPFLLAHSSSLPSGGSSLTTIGSQKHKKPTGPPCQEPQNSKDAVKHLTEVVCLLLEHYSRTTFP